jgi:hypothetical protein
MVLFSCVCLELLSKEGDKVPEHFQANEKEAKERSAKNAKVQIVLNPFIKLFVKGGFSKNRLGHGETSLAVVNGLIGVPFADAAKGKVFTFGNPEAHPGVFGCESDLERTRTQSIEFKRSAILCIEVLAEPPDKFGIEKRVADDRN